MRYNEFTMNVIQILQKYHIVEKLLDFNLFTFPSSNIHLTDSHIINNPYIPLFRFKLPGKQVNQDFFFNFLKVTSRPSWKNTERNLRKTLTKVHLLDIR